MLPKLRAPSGGGGADTGERAKRDCEAARTRLGVQAKRTLWRAMQRIRFEERVAGYGRTRTQGEREAVVGGMSSEVHMLDSTGE